MQASAVIGALKIVDAAIEPHRVALIVAALVKAANHRCMGPLEGLIFDAAFEEDILAQTDVLRAT